MDHVLRIGQNDDRSSDRNVNLIGGGHGLIRLRIRIGNFPPPLMACDLNGDWIFRCQAFDTLAGDHAQNQNDK